MDLQWINGTDIVAEMATKTNVNFNALQEGVSGEIATAKTEAITDTQTWAKGTFSNPNLLRNANFRKPINQRGLNTYTVPTSGFAYTIDGWKVSSGTLILGTDGISLTSDTDGQWFYQMLEEDLKGETVTFSAEIDGIVHVVTGIAPSANNQFITGDGIAITMINGYTSVIVQMKTTTITPSWAKLELGSVATPFVPRPYGEELALCMRYYQSELLFPKSVWGETFVYDGMNNFQLLTPMRVYPTVTISGDDFITTGNIRVWGGSTTDVFAQFISKSGFTLRAGLTMGVSYYFHWKADAEL